jgi:hypothetical protein
MFKSPLLEPISPPLKKTSKATKALEQLIRLPMRQKKIAVRLVKKVDSKEDDGIQVVKTRTRSGRLATQIKRI